MPNTNLNLTTMQILPIPFTMFSEIKYTHTNTDRGITAHKRTATTTHFADNTHALTYTLEQLYK